MKSLTYCIPMLLEIYSQFLGARRHSACTKTQLRRESHTWKEATTLEVVATKDWQLRCIFKSDEPAMTMHLHQCLVANDLEAPNTLLAGFDWDTSPCNQAERGILT